ncbi:MAG: hypothetical protein GY841_16285 [FCB group bacterium]|nr:hypothetical protein [FCB group bacterium]
MSNKFFKLCVWAMTFATIFSLGVVSCNMHIDYRIAQAIKDGANPVEARIAFSTGNSMADVPIALLRDKKCAE